MRDTINDLDSRLYDPLADPIRPYLWGITFINLNSTEEQSTVLRHYSTWCITADTGFLTGSLLSPLHRYFKYFKIINEFSSIAYQLIHLGQFQRHSALWYSSLSAALWATSQEEEEKGFHERLVELYHAPATEEIS